MTNAPVSLAWLLRWLSIATMLFSSGVMVTACTAPQAQSRPAVAAYQGELQVFLEPFDEKGVCSATIVLRNTSQVRMGEAQLTLKWFDHNGKQFPEQQIRMDGLLAGRQDAKNLPLSARCDQVARLAIRSAEWAPFEAWDARITHLVPIEGVDGSEWQMKWDAELRLFVGQAASPRTSGG